MISIIVPVYNSESTLKKCIESIIQQTYKNIEIILINDGSIDFSLEICYHYAKLDKRVRVINNKNKGVSATRNEGIALAKGEFIQFVDSDDFIEEYMCEELFTKINTDGSDLVICGYKEHVSEHSIIYRNCFNSIINNRTEFEKVFSDLYRDNYLNAPWNKLYRKSLITNFFDEKLSLGEDLLFNLSYLNNVKEISFIKSAGYNYLTLNPVNSLASVYREDAFDISCHLHERVLKFCRENFSSSFEVTILNYVFFLDTYIIIKRIVSNYKNSKSTVIRNINKIISNKLVRKSLENIKIDKIRYRYVGLLMKIKASYLIIKFFQLETVIKKLNLI